MKTLTSPCWFFNVYENIMKIANLHNPCLKKIEMFSKVYLFYIFYFEENFLHTSLQFKLWEKKMFQEIVKSFFRTVRFFNFDLNFSLNSINWNSSLIFSWSTQTLIKIVVCMSLYSNARLGSFTQCKGFMHIYCAVIYNLAYRCKIFGKVLILNYCQTCLDNCDLIQQCAALILHTFLGSGTPHIIQFLEK